MKLLPTLAIFPLLMCSLNAQLPTWSETVLATPFHVGDSKIAEMKRPQPNGKNYHAQFTIPASVAVNVATLVSIEIQEADISKINPKRTTKRPGIATKLSVNGIQDAVLNHLVNAPSAASKIQTLWIRVPSSVLQSGVNTIEIVPGADRRQQDDFELHHIVVSNRVPPG